jgi:hypothetical protein
VREEVVWLHAGRDLHLRQDLRLQDDLRMRRQLRLQRLEVRGNLRQKRGGIALPFSCCAQASRWLQPVLPGSPQVQSMQPRDAHEPHQRTTRFRSASRARNTRTPALLAVIPASAA